MSQTKGFLAEQHAQDYLKAQGLQWVESNYRCRLGEIDLIMRDGSCLVFIEVRSRASRTYGGALASVTYKKKQKLLQTASHYLLVNQLREKHAVRFDVVSLEGNPPVVSWVKQAFGLDF